MVSDHPLADWKAGYIGRRTDRIIKKDGEKTWVNLENAVSIPSTPTFINILIICDIDPGEFIKKLKNAGDYTWTDNNYICTDRRGI